MSADLSAYARDPIAFLDAHLPRNEKGQPWRLNRYQRRVLAWAFRRDPSGRLVMRLLLWAEPKKSGKSWIAACIGIWWAVVHPDTEVVIASNDLEQGNVAHPRHDAQGAGPQSRARSLGPGAGRGDPLHERLGGPGRGQRLQGGGGRASEPAAPR